MAKNYNKYPIPSDYVTKRQLDRLEDKLVVHTEHEQRKRTLLADKIRSLSAELSALKDVLVVQLKQYQEEE